MKQLLRLALGLGLMVSTGDTALAASAVDNRHILSRLPPLTRYEDLEFPEELLTSSVLDGYATLVFTVRDDGSVDDVLTLETSHAAFAAAAIDTVRVWKLVPNGNATVPRREVIRFEFERPLVVASLTHREAIKSFFPASDVESTPVRTVLWDELPDPPERLRGAKPLYPRSLAPSRPRGHVVVNFVIDERGSVRVPVVMLASHEEFGSAALEAVRQWRFAPPMHRERPVNVEVSRSFTFGAEPAAP